MRSDVQDLASDLDGHGDGAPTFLGRRWALRLGTALLAGLALTTAARWREGASPASRPEKIVQQPVPPEAFPSAVRADTAPDPGDNPP